MSFAPKAGCPMCSIVASASPMANGLRSPSFPSGSTAPEIIWKDDNFTAYRERAHPVSSRGHVVIIFNLHAPSVYTLSTSDVPLLVELSSLATRLLDRISGTPSTPSSSGFSPSLPSSTPLSSNPTTNRYEVGFITSPFKDNRIPVSDHLHAHAYVAPNDLCGWYRAIAYSSLAWYAIDDLIAEIRESSSNNRVKSGYEGRQNAPINTIPDAGSRSGTADGKETTEHGLGIPDLESAEHSTSSTPGLNGRTNRPSPLNLSA